MEGPPISRACGLWTALKATSPTEASKDTIMIFLMAPRFAIFVLIQCHTNQYSQCWLWFGSPGRGSRRAGQPLFLIWRKSCNAVTEKTACKFQILQESSSSCSNAHSHACHTRTFSIMRLCRKASEKMDEARLIQAIWIFQARFCHKRVQLLESCKNRIWRYGIET